MATDNKKQQIHDLDSGDTGYETEPTSAASNIDDDAFKQAHADNQQQQPVSSKDVILPKNAKYAYPTQKSKGMRKSNTVPDYFAKQTVLATNYKEAYVDSSRRKSLSLSRGRRLSYPLSDDNLKGKAMYSEWPCTSLPDGDSKGKVIDSNASSAPHVGWFNYYMCAYVVCVCVCVCVCVYVCVCVCLMAI